GGAAALPGPNVVETRKSTVEVPEATVSRSEVGERKTGEAAPSIPATGWVEAYQDMQRQTAEAHAAYQRAMADSHLAFLRVAESAFATLGAAMTGAPLPAAAPMPTVQPPVAAAPPAPAPAPARPAAPAADLTAILLAVVAEKTGYPAEMLNLDMELEADL